MGSSIHPSDAIMGIRLDWIGLDWIGLDWIGLDGLDWIFGRIFTSPSRRRQHQGQAIDGANGGFKLFPKTALPSRFFFGPCSVLVGRKIQKVRMNDSTSSLPPPLPPYTHANEDIQSQHLLAVKKYKQDVQKSSCVCNRNGTRCGSITLVLSLIVLALGAVLLSVSRNPNLLNLDAVIGRQAKSLLAVPTKNQTTGSFTYQDWLSNSNAKWHPPSYRSFYLYNMTSSFLSFYRGEKPTFERIGPYVYRKHWQRFPSTVEFSSDNSVVSYEAGIHYEFDAEKSRDGLAEDDLINHVNLPVLGALQLAAAGFASGDPNRVGYSSPIIQVLRYFLTLLFISLHFWTIASLSRPNFGASITLFSNVDGASPLTQLLISKQLHV